MIELKNYEKEVQDFIVRHIKLGAKAYIYPYDVSRLELRDKNGKAFAVLPSVITNK